MRNALISVLLNDLAAIFMTVSPFIFFMRGFAPFFNNRLSMFVGLNPKIAEPKARSINGVSFFGPGNFYIFDIWKFYINYVKKARVNTRATKVFCIFLYVS